jgi:hypothetical protein
MFRKGIFIALFLAVFELALLTNSRNALAQHSGGGGGGMGGGGGASGAGRPAGVAEKDDLRSFHRALALQASAQQSALFASAEHDFESASTQLQTLRGLLQKTPPAPLPSESISNLHDTIEKARRENQAFLASFSSAQKSGLKDLTKKLAKEESDLYRQAQAFDQSAQGAKPASEQLASVTSLDQSLSSFKNEQLAIAQEMSIVLSPSGEQLSFTLPAMPNSLTIAGQNMSLPAAGVIERSSSPSDKGLFHLSVNANLFDLQQDFTGVLRSALNRSPGCGERIEIKQAAITPTPPAAVVIAQLHFERWICSVGGAGNATEASASDGTFEVKLTPTIGQAAGLGIDTEISRIDAAGFLKNMLRSGDLGESLRQQIGAAVLDALRQSTSLKSALPPEYQKILNLQKAQFQNDGSNKLGFLLNGEMQLSDEQVKLLADQLKPKPSFKETSAR